MIYFKNLITVSLLLFSLQVPFFLSAQDGSDDNVYDEIQAAMYMDSIENSLQYKRGSIDIGDGLATLNVPDGYKYLEPEQTEMVLTELWGNPNGESLGMMLADSVGVYTDNTYAIVIQYEEMGYVEDDDAEDIDYDELLEEMQSDSKAENEYRKENGYGTVDLVGWASPPYYDQEGKKLHWAKELQFEDSETNTLNYNVRFLGRKGVLEMNFVSDIAQLGQVKTDIPNILESVAYKEGERYSDYDSSIDKVAAVGIGGLVAGKVLAKAGVFAMLLKFWKFIVAGAIGLFSVVRRFFGGKEEEEYLAEDDMDTDALPDNTLDNDENTSA